MPVHGTGVILFFSFLAAIDTRKGSYVNVADMMFDVGFLTRISTFGTKKNRQPCGRHHGVYLIGEPLPTTLKLAVDDIIKEVFLGEEWNSLCSPSKRPCYLHLKEFLKYKCELYLKQSLTPPQHKTIFAYHNSNHMILAIGNWMVVDSSSLHKLCTMSLSLRSYHAIEEKGTLCVGVSPL